MEKDEGDDGGEEDVHTCSGSSTPCHGNPHLRGGACEGEKEDEMAERRRMRGGQEESQEIGYDYGVSRNIISHVRTW